jgi:hypothetical protein
MATINGVSSTNNGNIVMWSFSTKQSYRTDRAAGTANRHDEVQAVENLGVGVTDTTSGLFTLLS